MKPLTLLDENGDPYPVDSPQAKWIEGWLDALKLMKERSVENRDKTNDGEALKLFDDLISYAQTLEKSSFSYQPTEVAFKRPSSPAEAE